MSLTSNISAPTWPNIKSRDSFEILRTCSFQNWPYFLNLAKQELRYCQKTNFKFFLCGNGLFLNLISQSKNYFQGQPQTLPIMAPTNLSGSYAYDQMSTYPPLTSVSGSPMYISNSVPLTNKIFNPSKPKVKWIAENLATVINPHLSPSFYNDQHLKVLLLNITCHHITGQIQNNTCKYFLRNFNLGPNLPKNIAFVHQTVLS